MSSFDMPTYFNAVRGTLFGGHLTEGQVNGQTTIFGAWLSKYAGADIRWLAYAFATAYHETARTMQPIEEWGRGAGRAYGSVDPQTRQVYYGRGLVQLTWKTNYAKFGTILGLDLVNHPELALIPEHAAAIMLIGMIEGTFTGRKLEDYFNPSSNAPINARRIINGTDCAALIASYYVHFKDALAAASAAVPETGSEAS